jgi:hypothetical protein
MGRGWITQSFIKKMAPLPETLCWMKDRWGGGWIYPRKWVPSPSQFILIHVTCVGSDKGVANPEMGPLIIFFYLLVFFTFFNQDFLV